MSAAAQVNYADTLTQGQIRWNTPPLPHMPNHALAIVIARACVGGEQNVEQVARRCAAVINKPSARWPVQLASRYLQTFALGTRPRERDVVRFVLHDIAWITSLRRKITRHPPRTPRPHRAVQQWLGEAPVMLPVPSAAEWPVPIIESTGALAEWLDVTVTELEWFADAKGLLRKHVNTPLQHYHYTLLEKRSGGLRIIEAPKPRLKQLQRRILGGILEKVPQYYTAAHGFVKGRSVQSFVAAHTGKHVVLRMDLQEFFPTIGVSRVQALFRTMGYPETVADLLGGLCTNAVPGEVLRRRAVNPSNLAAHVAARSTYTRPHLPQGAPTSPLVANMCAYRLDCRLTGLADWAGAAYTRYADDMAMSGNEDFARDVERYADEVAAIVLSEGWNVQHHKTRIMRQGVRQQLARIVVNKTPNIAREQFDALKATLTNCVRHGVHGQNRDGHSDFRAHLQGRVAWVASVNVQKGKRLRALYERIRWSDASLPTG